MMLATTVFPPSSQLAGFGERGALRLRSYPWIVQLAHLAWSFARNSSRILVIRHIDLVTVSRWIPAPPLWPDGFKKAINLT